MIANLILESANHTLLLIEERRTKDIVIGVPHHAPAGTPNLPCPEHWDADENAGFLGRYLAQALNCCSVIACNYTIDVNKSLCTDYAVQITRWQPTILVEIHGHGGKAAKSNIEISSGSSDNNRYSVPLADMLARGLAATDGLKDVSISGDYENLHFKASNSATIANAKWIPYHIELPPQLRKTPENGKPPHIAFAFCDLLITALRELHHFKS